MSPHHRDKFTNIRTLPQKKKIIARNKYVGLYFEHHCRNVRSAINDSCNDGFPLCSPYTHPASDRQQDMPAASTVRYTVNAVNPRVHYRKCKCLTNGDQLLFLPFSLKIVFILINIHHKRESE